MDPLRSETKEEDLGAKEASKERLEGRKRVPHVARYRGHVGPPLLALVAPRSWHRRRTRNHGGVYLEEPGAGSGERLEGCRVGESEVVGTDKREGRMACGDARADEAAAEAARGADHQDPAPGRLLGHRRRSAARPAKRMGEETRKCAVAYQTPLIGRHANQTV